MTSLPFSSIEQTPENFSGTNVITRLVEALGFRYRWATDGLSTADTEFSPVEGSKSIRQLLEHIYSMAKFLNKNTGGEQIKDDGSYTSEELIVKTLEVYRIIDTRLKAYTDAEFEAQEKRRLANGGTPFWYMLNGPLADSLTHVGQIASWRRIAGKPVPQGIDGFKGTTSF